MLLSLRAARVNAGYTQARAAKELGINPMTLSSWERGKTYPNSMYLYKLSKMYNVEPSDFFYVNRLVLN